VPVLSTILAKVPPMLLMPLTQALDNQIISNVYANSPITDQITNLVQGITEIANHFHVEDDLTVHTPTEDLNCRLEQKLSTVTFTLLGSSSVVASTSAVAVPGTGRVLPHADKPVADADLSIDSTTLSLPLGDLILKGAGPLLFQQFGGATNLNDALNNLVPCSSMGQSLSNAVGGLISPMEGATLCQGAVGLVASQVTAQIQKINFSGIFEQNGAGQLYDLSPTKPTVDYQSDYIANGTWTWTVSIQGNSTVIPTTFVGSRIGDAL
jgi:hypothetical protein